MPRRQWMRESKIVSLFRAGRTLEEIAEANERSEGWKPSRSAVSRKLERMGLEGPPRASHADLLPWKIAPRHNSDMFRRMLQAESRWRQGFTLSKNEEDARSLLNNFLWGRGAPLVVSYNRDIGFYLVRRVDADADIIRRPNLDDELSNQLGQADERPVEPADSPQKSDDEDGACSR
jgi:hypothetical protein